ncbi:MAG: hypothetical protein CL609_13245 [Anaerolineaceae bacterium]|nr:hypothetical protein [Anaerolineaceae bacterium]
MKFINGAEVFSSGNEKLGNIERVVLHPETNEVSHLVVSKGFIFKTDKVIPIEWVDKASEDKVILKKSETAYEDLPDFEESLFLPIDWTQPKRQYVRSAYWYPSYPFWGRTGTAFVQYPAHYVTQKMRNIPADSVALEEGAKVYSRDEEDLGDVEEVLVNEEHHTATHIIVSSGLLDKTQKMIPTFWIKSVNEDGLYLSIDEELYENLPEYQPADA